MEQRKTIYLPKAHLRGQSKARIEADSDEDAMDVDLTANPRAAQSNPNLRIGPSTPGLSTPGNREFSGMRTHYT